MMMADVSDTTFSLVRILNETYMGIFLSSLPFCLAQALQALQLVLPCLRDLQETLDLLG